ncbi:aldehyde dehydrogenase family-domain-containing protein [Aspergillus desertorum]
MPRTSSLERTKISLQSKNTPALFTDLTLPSQYAAASNCGEVHDSSFTGGPVYSSDTANYIAADHTDALLIISFRNTETSANLTSNWTYHQVDASGECPRCRAYRGFCHWNTRPRYPEYELMVTGHSLGGALATLHVVFLINRGVTAVSYTFGAPSVGSYAIARYTTNGHNGDSGMKYRVTHLNDSFPEVPYRTSRGPRASPLVLWYQIKMVQHYPNWIDGQEAPPTTTTIAVLNPATEETLATINATSSGAVNEIVTTSSKTFRSGVWSQKDPSDRFAVLSRASALLRSRINDFIALETAQTGRPIREMRTQLARVPEWLDYFASLARVHEGRVAPFKGAVTNTLTRLPLGVVVLITPYNHPLLIAMKKIAAALAAGNVVIVKPSELAPLSVLKLGALFKEAGLPDGVLQIVSGYGRETGKYLCEHPNISKIDLTGGIATYRAIAPVAALHMVPITAELGGKAPVCIFPSMDVETAVKAALFAGFIASGQTCVTGSRLLVHKDIYDSFKSLLEKRVRALRVGDPTDEKTQIGSVISAAAIERCESFVSGATAEGGTILCGGAKLTPTLERRGFFFAPTVIETVSTSDLANNEVFGPVLALIKCSDEDEIVRIANGTSYALGASVWSNDFMQAHRVAHRIEAGIVWINGHHLNDPSSPWGGFRESGVGKENGVEAYESYTKVKSTVMNYGVKPVWFDDEVANARYG